jgi:hypothetical protein
MASFTRCVLEVTPTMAPLQHSANQDVEMDPILHFILLDLNSRRTRRKSSLNYLVVVPVGTKTRVKVKVPC